MTAKTIFLSLSIAFISCFYSVAQEPVEMMAVGTILKWQKNGNGFLISIPEKIRNSPPSKYVWIMKATF